MERPAEATPRKTRRRWWAMSVRGMLLLVLAVGLALGWWARKSQLQRAAARRIDDLDAAVIYEFEGLDEGRATPEAEHRVYLARLGAGATVQVPRQAPPKARPKDWTRSRFGVDYQEWARDHLGVDYSDAVTRVLAEHSSKIRDEDLATLLDFPRLEVLNLGETHVGDAGLAHLAGLRSLQELHLDTTQVTDAGLAHLERLARLETLSLADNGDAITDAGLARLEPLKALKVLEVGGPKITDAGLEHLRGLKNLKKLVLIEAPHVTEAGIARLRSALPNLEITQHTSRRSKPGTPARVNPRSLRRRSSPSRGDGIGR